MVVHTYDDVRGWTVLIDPESGAEEWLEIGFGRLSNDGTRIVGYRDVGKTLCVMPISGGRCDTIASGDLLPSMEHTAGLQWSPDDRWIAVYPQDDSGWVILDSESGTPVRPEWDVESWQRVAPSTFWGLW